MKKIFAIMLAMIMMLSMAAMAATTITIIPNEVPKDSTGTESGTEAGITYTAYKIFDAVVNGDNVSYTIDSTSPYYTTIDGMKETFKLTQVNDTTTYIVEKIAEYNAAELAETLSAISATSAGTGVKDATTGKYSITVDVQGYYLITSSVGTALILDTTTDEEIQAKNYYPSLTKSVDKTTADWGTDVIYTIVVTVPATAEGPIVVHDTLEGATYNAENTTLPSGVTKADGAEGCCTIEFTIDAATVASIAAAADKTITINYAATVEAHLVTNEAYLVDGSYTSATEEAEDVVNADVEVYKYEMKDNQKVGLAGAGFVIKNSAGKYYKNTDDVISWVDLDEEPTELMSAEEGDFSVLFEGIATGTYTLVENTVPAGYNPAQDQQFTLTVDGKTGEARIEVENKTGTALPSTGGIGTTIFYVVGGLMMAAAIVLLVTKKKVAASK